MMATSALNDRNDDRIDSGIRFLLNGQVVAVDDVPPTQSLLSFLRERKHLTGSKEGCAEGDCGACTVVVAELRGEMLKSQTINACIQFVPALDGKAIFTVEGLRQANGRLHPAQQAMVDCHASQCGFCTPGFVMSLWQLYNAHSTSGTVPGERDLRTSLSGNLCRCTGYRPILEAGRAMFDLPRVPFDGLEVKNALRALAREHSLVYVTDLATFYSPKSLEELLALRNALPEATLLAGCTDIGLWVNKQFRPLGDIIYVGEVEELKFVKTTDNELKIGASVSLSDAWQVIVEHYPELTEMWERFASVPIRNAGTLGGNIANGSPIGDSMPGLIALGSQVVLTSSDGSRTLHLEDLYLDYMKNVIRPNEILDTIIIPLPVHNQYFRSYKLAKRYDSDISAVCAAFAITTNDEQRVTRARVVFGGMAGTPKRAPNCEAALLGQVWDEACASSAKAALTKDYEPLSDMRASSVNRMQVAQNLLRKFYFETNANNPLPPVESSVWNAD